MSEINSIANGTFTIGSTSATNFIAGPGISITQPSEGTVRIGNDETVLWEGDSWVSASPIIKLTETIANFERIGIYAGGYGNTNQQDFKIIKLSAADTANGAPLNIQGIAGNGTFIRFNAGLVFPSANGTALQFQNFRQFNLGDTVNTGTSPSKIRKVVGINRKEV